MKKLLGILILIGAYVAVTYYMGVQGEKSLRQQFAMAEQQGARQGISLELNSYERGIFFSEMDVTATYVNVALPAAPIKIHSHSKIQHGPLYFYGSFGAGLFSSKSTIEIETADAEINQGITDLFGKSIGEITTVGHFNQSYTSTWSVAKIEHSEDGNKVTLDGVALTINGNMNKLDSYGSFTIGASEIVAEDGTKMTTTPMLGHFDMKSIAEGVSIGDMDMEIANISFLNASMVGFSVENFKITQTQKLVNDKIDTNVSFTADKVKSPVEINNLHYDIALNQLAPAAIQKWTEIAAAAQAMPPEEALAMYGESVAELAPLLLQEGLQFKLGLGADFMGGSALLDLTANYQELPGGQQVKDINDPIDYLKLVDAEALLKVSEAIVTQTPMFMMLGPYMDTYVTQEGDNFIVHATLKDGKLMVGNTEIPAEVLLAFLPGAAMADAGSTQDDPAMNDPVQ